MPAKAGARSASTATVASGGVPFDPATGDWSAAPPAVPPDAPAKGPRATLMRILLGLDLAVLALLLLSGLVVAVARLLQPESSLAQQADAASGSVTTGALVVNGLVLLVCGGLIPLVAIAGSRVRPWEGTVRYFRLERPWPSIGQGVLVGIGLVVVSMVLLMAAYWGYAALTNQEFGNVTAQNQSEELTSIVALMTLPLAAFVALSAGIGEEVLFRGLLQRSVGVWGQAVLFALSHTQYGTVAQVVAPFALGLFLGILVKRGAPLWLAISAHATFNFVELMLAKLGV